LHTGKRMYVCMCGRICCYIHTRHRSSRAACARSKWSTAGYGLAGSGVLLTASCTRASSRSSWLSTAYCSITPSAATRSATAPVRTCMWQPCGGWSDHACMKMHSMRKDVSRTCVCTTQEVYGTAPRHHTAPQHRANAVIITGDVPALPFLCLSCSCHIQHPCGLQLSSAHAASLHCSARA
jgi:hypothetical protein